MTVRLLVRQRSEAGGHEKPAELLLPDEKITLGRDPTCQVVLAQKAVSRAHARISRDGALNFIEDLGSAYGTQVNGQKIPKGEKRLLRAGDVIAIAQFDVTFDKVSERSHPPEGEESAENTAFIARKAVREVMRGVGGAQATQPCFRVMNGPREGERLELANARELVMGRDESADLILKDDLVSRRHAKVRRDWSGTHVEDLGSRNGIRVNRRRVTHRTLKDQDELEVGSTRFLYLDPDAATEAPLAGSLAEELEETRMPEEPENSLPPEGSEPPNPVVSGPPLAPEDEPEPELDPADEAPEDSLLSGAPEDSSFSERLDGSEEEEPEGGKNLLKRLLQNRKRLVLLIAMSVCLLGLLVLLILIFSGV